MGKPQEECVFLLYSRLSLLLFVHVLVGLWGHNSVIQRFLLEIIMISSSFSKRQVLISGCVLALSVERLRNKRISGQQMELLRLAGSCIILSRTYRSTYVEHTN